MNIRRLMKLGVAASITSVAILGQGAALAANSHSSDVQITLSGIGPSSVGASGFWLWSQPPAGDAYGTNGGDGSGNVYFYDAHVQKPVDISNVVLNGNVVDEDVNSSDGSIACHFHAVENTPTTGNNNGTVSFSCTAPSATGSYPAKVNISNFHG
jgi:hypothetical protein